MPFVCSGSKQNTESEKPFLKLVCENRLAEQKTLELIAAALFEKLPLKFAFNPFGNHLQTEGMRHNYNRLNNGRVILIGFQITDKGTVDFQGIDRETGQIAQ